MLCHFLVASKKYNVLKDSEKLQPQIPESKLSDKDTMKHNTDFSARSARE